MPFLTPFLSFPLFTALNVIIRLIRQIALRCNGRISFSQIKRKCGKQ
ncbi:hypothetical protein [Rodentibacter trehalosifermentans]|nr:hypothetical protein [Rodentibacter trehalosifermentans]